MREAALLDWARTVADRPFEALLPVSGDASFRRYFRLRFDDRSWIAVDAPPEQEDSRPFVALAARLGEAGLHVPRVLASDLGRGFMLLTDLGDTLYLDALNPASADDLYGAALDALLRLQAIPATDLPAYDAALLMREMELFRDWYLQRHLGVVLDAPAHAVLDVSFAALCEAALAQPRVFVHRDYHSRNLMVCAPNPGILDFQDAVHGPVTYDLVSLLRDCYIAWPEAQVEAWVEAYRLRALAVGLLPATDAATFRRWFDWMGVQRHLKAIGIFARLQHRDGKPAYLQDIPRTLGYVRQVAGRYPELRALVGLLDDVGL